MESFRGKKGSWDCGKNTSWVQPGSHPTWGQYWIQVSANVATTGWYASVSRFVLEETNLEGWVIAISLQTSILTWTTTHYPLGPRAWRTWGLAASGAWPQCILWTNIQEDQCLRDSAVLSFIYYKGRWMPPADKSESWANSPLNNETPGMWCGEIRCREFKSQSENTAFHSRAGGMPNKNRLSGGPQIHTAFRELKGVVKRE